MSLLRFLTLTAILGAGFVLAERVVSGDSREGASVSMMQVPVSIPVEVIELGGEPTLRRVAVHE